MPAWWRGGGVCANPELRARLEALGQDRQVAVRFPAPEFCTDNGAMIACAGYLRLAAGERAGMAFSVRPRWPLGCDRRMTGKAGSDVIFLRGLRVQAVIGVFSWERHIKQDVVIDLELYTDIGAAAQSDCLEQALDYKCIAKRVCAIAGSSRFRLVESLAEAIASGLLEEFPITRLKLRIDKHGAVRGARGVGVEIVPWRGLKYGFTWAWAAT